tara:strand:+ start:4039 stop:5196 length:1158 start_codon:yes stop_codon:yes gene_type:complete
MGPLQYLTDPKSHQLYKRISIVEELGIDWDTRSIHEVIKNLNDQGIDAYPATFPQDSFNSSWIQEKFGTSPTRIWPLSGISRVKTVYGIESGRYMIYSSDRYGFNNDDNVYDQTEYPIIILGDSFVHGCCVQEGEDIAGNLRTRGHNAINLGMGGNGPLNNLATLREYGETIQPKLILWLYYENDWENLKTEFSHPLLQQYINNPEFRQSLVVRQSETDLFWKSAIQIYNNDVTTSTDSGSVVKATIETTAINVTKFILLDNIWSIIRRIIAIPSDGNQESEHVEAFSKVLENAKLESARLGANLHFIHLPSYGSVVNRDNRSGDRILTLVKQLDIPVIDLYEVISLLEDPLHVFPLRMRGHYNKEGYSLLAEIIEDKVISEQSP